MKNFIATCCLVAVTGISAHAQVTVTSGSNTQPFKLEKKQPSFSAFSNAGADYFFIKRVQNFENINTMIVADKTGNIKTLKDIRIDRGTFTDNADVKTVIVMASKTGAFIERRTKSANKSSLTVRLVDDNGNLGADEPVGDISFTKFSNPGDWYVAATPDKKHVAVIAQLPHEKDTPDQFKYFFLDENFKEISKGQLSFSGDTKKIPIFNFLASDKGDLYLIAEEFDKSYKYPVVYKVAAGAAGSSIIPVMVPDPSLRNLNYTASVNNAGDLILAGYTQQKRTFSAGDVATMGTWLFNSSKPTEVKIFPFDKPVISLTARNIVYNGDNFFLVGEQYKEDKEATSMAAMQRAPFDENFTYTHGDIQVTAFSSDGAKKFDITVSRNKWTATNFDESLMLASGIINNKLALIFNDQYGKYFTDYRELKNYKLPVAVLVNNDGLMEAPVSFVKELNSRSSYYTLLPQFFNANNGRVTVLMNTNEGIKTEIFK